MSLCLSVSAGLFSMNDTLPGFSDDLSRLSYNGRNVLGEQLNRRETFKKFCHAMGVDEELTTVCLRSRNPTSYLIQEIDGRPYATFSRLEQALTSIGERALFEQVWELVDNSSAYD